MIVPGILTVTELVPVEPEFFGIEVDAQRELIAFVAEPDNVVQILEHLDLPATPPPLAPGPPLDDAAHTPVFDLAAPEPVPDESRARCITSPTHYRLRRSAWAEHAREAMRFVARKQSHIGTVFFDHPKWHSGSGMDRR